MSRKACVHVRAAVAVVQEQFGPMMLFLLAVTIPCWYGYRRSVSGGRVEINHVTTFSLGFLYYWITPLAVRILAAHLVFPLSGAWLGLFRERWIAPYALSCIALYLCFILGDSLGARWWRRQRTESAKPIPTLALSLATAFGCALLAYSVYVERAELFRPSVPGAIQIHTALGEVTGCVVLLSCVALMFSLQRRETPWRALLLSRYFLPVLLGGGMMLLLGSRLYIASLVVMYAIYETNFRARFKLKKMIAVGLLFAVFFGLVGTWRQDTSPTGVFSNILAEPMLISLSLVHHLRYKGMAWINEPTELISDLENLIPTVLMPNKYKLLKQPDAWRPLGGLHSFVSFDLYFGLLGTAAFWFLMPLGFRYLRSRLSNTLFATMYVMCSGWLTFSFFRNAFSLSLVKNIFEQSILVPCLIAGFGWLLVAACSPASAGRSDAPPLPPHDAAGEASLSGSASPSCRFISSRQSSTARLLSALTRAPYEPAEQDGSQR